MTHLQRPALLRLAQSPLIVDLIRICSAKSAHAEKCKLIFNCSLFLPSLQEYQRQSSLAFDCFYFLLNNGEIKYQWKLLFNFWSLAIKNCLSDSKTIVSLRFCGSLEIADFRSLKINFLIVRLLARLQIQFGHLKCVRVCEE